MEFLVEVCQLEHVLVVLEFVLEVKLLELEFQLVEESVVVIDGDKLFVYIVVQHFHVLQ